MSFALDLVTEKLGPAPGDKHGGPFGSEPKAYGKLPPGANWEAWKRSAHPGIRHYLVRVG